MMRVFIERYFRTDHNTEAAAGGVLQKLGIRQKDVPQYNCS